MAHEKVYGICENMCQVEVTKKEDVDAIREDVDEVIERPYIVEQGSTTTNCYRKWNDGTLECWGKGTATYANPSILLGSVYYPKEFISPPCCFVTKNDAKNNDHSWIGFDTRTQVLSSRVTASFGTLQDNVASYDQMPFSYYAIGRWK